MFNNWKVINQIVKSGIVAVVRANSADEAIKISKACLEGGISEIGRAHV